MSELVTAKNIADLFLDLSEKNALDAETTLILLKLIKVYDVVRAMNNNYHYNSENKKFKNTLLTVLNKFINTDEKFLEYREFFFTRVSTSDLKLNYIRYLCVDTIYNMPDPDPLNSWKHTYALKEDSENVWYLEKHSQFNLTYKYEFYSDDSNVTIVTV